ncbi:hypothetical protein FS837_007751 [Tulasnella sp. UAMH 9824]|nr:hypothetical protein FS837_007751 [Tulasnella sp. UAMH 9824]
MSAQEEDELKPTFAQGFKLGQDASPEELLQKDKGDESLERWKASLGLDAATAGASASASGPKVTPIALVLTSPTLPQGKKIEMDLTDPRTVESYRKSPFNIKEGVEYSVTVKFKVNHGIVSGLRYMHVAKVKGVTADRTEEMLGSYGPKPDGGAYEKTLPAEESPDGFVARNAGTYYVTSLITDDDQNKYLKFEWCFKLTKEW